MREEKEKIIKSVLGRGYSSGKELLFYCPFCEHHKMKMAVNVSKGVFKCWICDKSGSSLDYLVRKFGSSEDRKHWKKFEKAVDVSLYEDLFSRPHKPVEQRIDLPKEFVSLTGKPSHRGHHDALRYLTGRGITRDDIMRWKIGYCAEGEFAGRIIIPSFNKDGWVDYYIARSWGREWPRYKNPPVNRDLIFNELYLNWDEEIVIVEGVFDAIKAGNAIPLLGSTLRESSVIFEALIKNSARVLLALDADAQGKSRSIARLLSYYGVETYAIDTTGFEDVGAMSKEEFNARKENASFNEEDNYLLEKLLLV
tara:strand:- start:791 stop:1720 length:930 start_codon:yes stop_codon:yes gene_type:complete